MALAANADMFSKIKRFPKGDARDKPAHACFLRSTDRQRAEIFAMRKTDMLRSAKRGAVLHATAPRFGNIFSV